MNSRTEDIRIRSTINRWPLISRRYAFFIAFALVIAVAPILTSVTRFVGIQPTYAAEPPFSLPKASELNKLKSALIVTTRGEMRFELYPETAPWHVANFKYLADKGFYKGLSFSYYQSRYLIQGGAMNTGNGLGYSLPPEFSDRKHIFGALGMARRPDDINPERRSHASVFQIVLGSGQNLDGQYTTFGQLVEGDDVLTSLRDGDVIQQVKVFVRRDNQ